jgi:hypothetical protein
LDGKLVQLVEIIRGVCEDITVDIEEGKILKNGFLEFSLDRRKD